MNKKLWRDYPPKAAGYYWCRYKTKRGATRTNVVFICDHRWLPPDPGANRPWPSIPYVHMDFVGLGSNLNYVHSRKQWMYVPGMDYLSGKALVRAGEKKITALFRHAPVKYVPSPSLKEIKKELQDL